MSLIYPVSLVTFDVMTMKMVVTAGGLLMETIFAFEASVFVMINPRWKFLLFPNYVHLRVF